VLSVSLAFVCLLKISSLLLFLSIHFTVRRLKLEGSYFLYTLSSGQTLSELAKYAQPQLQSCVAARRDSPSNIIQFENQRNKILMAAVLPASYFIHLFISLMVYIYTLY